MIEDVTVYVSRNLANRDLFSNELQYPSMKTTLPLLMAGDVFYPKEGWAGMDVIRREATAGMGVNIIVEGSHWDIGELHRAGFNCFYEHSKGNS
jgi:hypothetical protein